MNTRTLILTVIFSLVAQSGTMAQSESAASTKVGNLLSNGDFQNRLKTWKLESYRNQGTHRIDQQLRHGDQPTLRLDNSSEDNTMANQFIPVKRHTHYRITAFTKAEGIRFFESGRDGACLGIRGTMERSAPIPATSDWRKIVFDFNSRERTRVEVGPHLGWHASMVTGTAWFAEVRMVENSQARPENLFLNGDFHQGLQEWDTVSYQGRGRHRLDPEVLFGGRPTLRLNNKRADHTMANQIIAVKPNTSYRITAFARTEGVQFMEGGEDSACLGIRGTFEKSDRIPPTSDWQKITLEFESGNRTEVEVGPHLGWHSSMVKGTAWFADVFMEKR